MKNNEQGQKPQEAMQYQKSMFNLKINHVKENSIPETEYLVFEPRWRGVSQYSWSFRESAPIMFTSEERSGLLVFEIQVVSYLCRKLSMSPWTHWGRGNCKEAGRLRLPRLLPNGGHKPAISPKLTRWDKIWSVSGLGNGPPHFLSWMCL